MNILKRVLGLMIVGTLSACASVVGNQQLKDQSEASIAQKIAEGKTSKEEVTAALGKASSINLTESGNEVWVYKYVRKSPKARNFIPIAGLFISGMDVTTKELAIMFNRDGIVSKYVMLESRDEMRNEILE